MSECASWDINEWQNQWGEDCWGRFDWWDDEHHRHARRYVRKNMITISAKFWQPGVAPADQVQPATASVNISYIDSQGAPPVATEINMTYASGTGLWTAQWDSSGSIGGAREDDCNGYVYFVVFSSGNGVQAADQGRFFVSANQANDI
jgi:hypothetical protein